uniref:Protein kinase domain-containing protein n=1 Tax=Panagrellus redivivus TaxID=6233 RepID=A0A7E4UMV5_PANRE
MSCGVYLALSFKNKTLGASFYDEAQAYVYYMPDVFEDEAYSPLRMLIDDVRPNNVIASCAQNAGFLKALRLICNFNAPNATKYDESVDDAGGDDEPEAAHFDVATGYELSQQNGRNLGGAEAGSNVPVYDGAAVAAKFNAGQEASGGMIVSTTAQQPEEAEQPEEELFAVLHLMPSVAFSVSVVRQQTDPFSSIDTVPSATFIKIATWNSRRPFGPFTIHGNNHPGVPPAAAGNAPSGSASLGAAASTSNAGSGSGADLSAFVGSFGAVTGANASPMFGSGPSGSGFGGFPAIPSTSTAPSGLMLPSLANTSAQAPEATSRILNDAYVTCLLYTMLLNQRGAGNGTPTGSGNQPGSSLMMLNQGPPPSQMLPPQPSLLGLFQAQQQRRQPLDYAALASVQQRRQSTSFSSPAIHQAPPQPPNQQLTLSALQALQQAPNAAFLQALMPPPPQSQLQPPPPQHVFTDELQQAERLEDLQQHGIASGSASHRLFARLQQQHWPDTTHPSSTNRVVPSSMKRPSHDEMTNSTTTDGGSPCKNKRRTSSDPSLRSPFSSLSNLAVSQCSSLKAALQACRLPSKTYPMTPMMPPSQSVDIPVTTPPPVELEVLDPVFPRTRLVEIPVNYQHAMFEHWLRNKSMTEDEKAELFKDRWKQPKNHVSHFFNICLKNSETRKQRRPTNYCPYCCVRTDNMPLHVKKISHLLNFEKYYHIRPKSM